MDSPFETAPEDLAVEDALRAFCLRHKPSVDELDQMLTDVGNIIIQRNTALIETAGTQGIEGLYSLNFNPLEWSRKWLPFEESKTELLVNEITELMTKFDPSGTPHAKMQSIGQDLLFLMRLSQGSRVRGHPDFLRTILVLDRYTQCRLGLQDMQKRCIAVDKSVKLMGRTETCCVVADSMINFAIDLAIKCFIITLVLKLLQAMTGQKSMPEPTGDAP